MRMLMTTVLLVASAAGLVAESAGGVRWTAPAGWNAEAPRPMRAATYTVTPAAGEKGVAECVVNYFGPGDAGGVEANIDRWKGQMLGRDGKPAPAGSEVAFAAVDEALLRLQSRRIRQLYGLVEDLNTLPLRARLAKQLNHLVRSYGTPSLSDAKAIRISLQLAQEELAQLLGASRQRVNQELKQMEREQVIRIEPGGLVVLDRDGLLAIVNSDH